MSRGDAPSRARIARRLAWVIFFPALFMAAGLIGAALAATLVWIGDLLAGTPFPRWLITSAVGAVILGVPVGLFAAFMDKRRP